MNLLQCSFKHFMRTLLLSTLAAHCITCRAIDRNEDIEKGREWMRMNALANAPIELIAYGRQASSLVIRFGVIGSENAAAITLLLLDGIKSTDFCYSLNLPKVGQPEALLKQNFKLALQSINANDPVIEIAKWAETKLEKNRNGSEGESTNSPSLLFVEIANSAGKVMQLKWYNDDSALDERARLLVTWLYVYCYGIPSAEFKGFRPLLKETK